MKYLVYAISGIMWISGIVLAKGGLLKAIAVVIPFYAYYLVVEKSMTMLGIA